MGTSNVVCVIQARMGSTRLPGKSMMKLGGKTLIEHVVERAKKACLIDKIVLATTRSHNDDILVDVAKNMSVEFYRGSTDDLVSRYYHAAKQYYANMVVRIPADNPLIMPYYIDKIIHYFKSHDLDFASNIGPYLDNACPDGLGAEVFSFSVLRRIHNTVNDKYHREHVTSVFRDHEDAYRVGTIKCDKKHQRTDIVLDINTQSEFDYMKKLFEDIQCDDLYDVNKIIAWADSVNVRR